MQNVKPFPAALRSLKCGIILMMGEANASHFTFQDASARVLTRCRLQLRDYRRELSNALCQDFLSNVLPVPECPHRELAYWPVWLECVYARQGVASRRGASDAFCQPQPIIAAAFDRRDIMSQCSGEVLRKLKSSMRPRHLPDAGSLMPDDLLHESPVCSPPSELDVSVMEVPTKKV